MKFDLNTPIWDEKTVRILRRAEPKATVDPINLGQILTQLLVGGMPEGGGRGLHTDDKAKQYAIMVRISLAEDDGGIIELSIDELAMLKKLADATARALIFGRLMDILDNPIPATGGQK